MDREERDPSGTTPPRRHRGLAAMAIAASSGYAAVLLRDGLWRFAHRTPDGRLGPSQLDGFHLARGILNGCFIVLIAIYVLWLIRSVEEVRPFRGLLQRALIFLALAFVAYPATSDVYNYLHTGAMAVRGVNPYLTPADHVSTPEMPIVSDWKGPSSYGPVAQMLFMACAPSARRSPVLAVYMFKAYCLVAHVLNAFLLWRTLSASGLRSKLTMAYLVNPSLLSMHVAEAHLDVFVCTATILMIGNALSGRLFKSALAAWAGALTKTLPILWLPLLASFMLRRRDWKALGGTAVVSVLICGLLHATLLPTAEAWKCLLNPGVRGMAARSIHHLVSLLLEHGLAADPELRTVFLVQGVRIGLGVFGLYYLWILIKPQFRSTYSESALAADLGWVTLALFLLATPWMMPWYPTVLLPFALLAGAPFLCLCSLAFSLSTGLIYGDGAGRSAISMLTTLVNLGPLLAAFVWRRRLTGWATAWLGGAWEPGPGPIPGALWPSGEQVPAIPFGPAPRAGTPAKSAGPLGSVHPAGKNDRSETGSGPG